jgi:MOSC domain-containing protein YiiM
MEMKKLMVQYAQFGTVAGIFLRPGRRKPVNKASTTMAIAGQGLEGDRYRASGTRQVTLIQAEHIPVICSFLGKESVDPGALRRNIIARGINLLALKGKKFRMGSALLEYSGECHPCSRMEETLGRGGYNAMRGHGGILARILETGRINVGDAIIVIDAEAPETSKTIG